jgi:hypothetical protein
MAYDDDSSAATLEPLMGCSRTPIFVNLRLTYTDSSGAQRSVSAFVDANWSYSITEPVGGASHVGTYAGGHDHGGTPQSSVFYRDGLDGGTPSVDDIWFNLDAFTQLMVATRQLPKGRKGEGNFVNPPAWMRNQGKQLDWEVV